jgi:hypothetical protein
MNATSTLPLTVTPEAAAYIAALGMQKEFEQMLEHARQTIPGLRNIQVTLQPAHDMELPCILLEPTRDDPHSLDDPVDMEWLRWRDDTFPAYVCQHFSILSNYG